MWLVSNVSLGLALGSSIAIGAGEAGERVYTCRDCVPHYLQYKFKFIIISFFGIYIYVRVTSVLGLRFDLTGLNNVGLRGAAAVDGSACLPGSSIETGPGKPGERMSRRRGCVQH